jgi:hypothetical protein
VMLSCRESGPQQQAHAAALHRGSLNRERVVRSALAAIYPRCSSQRCKRCAFQPAAARVAVLFLDMLLSAPAGPRSDPAGARLHALHELQGPVQTGGSSSSSQQ